MSKLVLGLGLGFYLTLGPMMTSELTPVVLRGVATSGVNLGIAMGQLLSNAAIAGFGNRTDRWSYRAPFALQLTFAAILLIGWPFAPESPFWLVRKGRTEDARRVLQKLYGNGIDIQSKLTALQVTVAEEQALKEQGKESGLLDAFRGTNRIRTIISMGVFVCQHAVGIIFVLGYSSCKFSRLFAVQLMCSMLMCPNRLLPACWSRDDAVVQSRAWRNSMRSLGQSPKLVLHQQRRSSQDLRVGHGLIDSNAVVNRHHGRCTNTGGQMGSGVHHSHLGVRVFLHNWSHGFRNPR